MLYLDIEKVRFDDRLKVTVDIDDDVKQALVPSLFLQPLIENSIKYAIAKLEEGGEIVIRAQRFSEDLLITVADNGPGCTKPLESLSESGGVGLANTRERLQALYGKNYSFTLTPNKPRGLRIEIRIPLEQVE